jgi:hypothetical protein
MFVVVLLYMACKDIGLTSNLLARSNLFWVFVDDRLGSIHYESLVQGVYVNGYRLANKVWCDFAFYVIGK